MMTTHTPEPFQPLPADAAGVVSWVHIGDLHLTEPDAQNARDLETLVGEIDRTFARRISFVFLPGDVAEHGRPEEFALARHALDGLDVPWCAIVGDHDVQQRSFEPFRAAMSKDLTYMFQAGDLDFVAMNAFDVPDPGSFSVSQDQLRWAQSKLDATAQAGRRAVLLLHCYPSDLKQGRESLSGLVARPEVRLVEMGHTHYNEVANDGQTLYIATRSTGQIEEGPVGFSVTSIDRDVVSWRFIELQSRARSNPIVMITSPADERFLSDASRVNTSRADRMKVRAKIWTDATPTRVVAHLKDSHAELKPLPGSCVWEGVVDCRDVLDGAHALRVTVEDASGVVAEDEIRTLLGAARPLPRAPRDQDNPLPAWSERGLLGTQLGPNKNGRKW